MERLLCYQVATTSRLLSTIGLFCRITSLYRALLHKRQFKEPPNRSHPLVRDRISRRDGMSLSASSQISQTSNCRMKCVAVRVCRVWNKVDCHLYFRHISRSDCLQCWKMNRIQRFGPFVFTFTSAYVYVCVHTYIREYTCT